MTRLTTIAAGLALALLAAAHPATAQTKLKMTYTAVTGFTAGYVAEQQGFFQKHGVDVDFVQTNISGNIPAVIESGSSELGGPTLPSLLQANDAGLDLVVFAGGAVYPLSGDVLIARKGAGIQKVTDLKGKTVGVPGIGALLHIMLRRDLKANGVDPNSVKFVELGFPQAGDALRSGQIDAYPVAGAFHRAHPAIGRRRSGRQLAERDAGRYTDGDLRDDALMGQGAQERDQCDAGRDARGARVHEGSSRRDQSGDRQIHRPCRRPWSARSRRRSSMSISRRSRSSSGSTSAKEQGLIKGNPKPEDIWFQ